MQPLSKKVEQAFKSSTDRQQNFFAKAKADVICSLQDQLANMSNKHKRDIDNQENCLVELIAVLENDCNEL